MPNSASKKLQPAPGLRVELFAGEPLLKNPVAFSIEKRERGLSSMPEAIGNVLTKSELRDIIEFLAGLK